MEWYRKCRGDGQYSAGGCEGNREAELFSADQFSGARMDQFDAVAFGCPAMGDEVLEETEFEPMFNDCEPALKGKRIELFGSDGWGDGEWMRNWEDTCRGDGAILVADSVICTDAPDSDAEEACEALGKVLAQG